MIRALLAVLVWWSAVLALPAPAVAAGDAVAGRALAIRWCASCHAVEGSRVATDKADPLSAFARDPQFGDDRLRGFLAKPHGRMPELTLSGQEIEDLIAYIASLRRP